MTCGPAPNMRLAVIALKAELISEMTTSSRPSCISGRRCSSSDARWAMTASVCTLRSIDSLVDCSSVMQRSGPKLLSMMCVRFSGTRHNFSSVAAASTLSAGCRPIASSWKTRWMPPAIPSAPISRRIALLEARILARARLTVAVSASSPRMGAHASSTRLLAVAPMVNWPPLEPTGRANNCANQPQAANISRSLENQSFASLWLTRR